MRACGEPATELDEEPLSVPLRIIPHAPERGVRAVIRDACGYAEITGAPARRRELPSADVIVIFNLGEPLLVAPLGSPARRVAGGSGFAAGLHESYTVTETAGSQTGIELRLAPPGAYHLFAQPLDALANQSVGLDALLGPWARNLAARMLETESWPARFAALDSALAARLANAPQPSPEVVWAWQQLVRSGGSIPIAALTAELRWSPRRLIAQFREQIGTTPKQAARLIRFQQVSTAIAREREPDWATLAQHHGYYDQSHLVNDVRAFAGDSPVGLLRRRLPTGGFAAD